MQIQLTAVYRKSQTGYVAFVEEPPGANTLVLEANRTLSEEALTGQEAIREAIRFQAGTRTPV